METKKNPSLEIGRHSSIYFAIGLNMMLLFTWQALEFKTYESAPTSYEIVEMAPEFEEDIPITELNTPLPPPPPPPVAISESIEVVASLEDIEETLIESTESSQDIAIYDKDLPIRVEDVVAVEDVEEDVEVPFAAIEHIPVFPGCEGLSGEDAKACFQAQMINHIKDHFKYPEEALDLGIQGRVSVLFVIDENGRITGIKSRGPGKILEEEAERIVKLLPKMTPGKQRGKPVKVSYTVPIFFKYKAQ